MSLRSHSLYIILFELAPLPGGNVNRFVSAYHAIAFLNELA